MKKQWLGALGLAFLAVVLAAASVPVDAANLQCNVPFSFQVGSATLPPGTYNVGVNQSTLQIRGAVTGALTMGNRVENDANDSPKLVFHRYGDEYILREVWTGRTGRAIPASRRERELKTRVSSFETVAIPLS
ncbi:MAG TPA: hypothetical protein VIC87_00415 [Vicinamibacteria bacterium]|jgi:hypothetical protein